MSYGWGVHECIWTLFEGDCTTTSTTTARPDETDIMGQENEVSTGFHFIEIHTRSVGLTLTTIIFMLLFALLLWGCYCRFCGTTSLCPPAPAQQPQAFEMQPMQQMHPHMMHPHMPYANQPMPRPPYLVYSHWSHAPPTSMHLPAISYERERPPPAYANEERPHLFEEPCPRPAARPARREASPPRIITLDRSPGTPRRAHLSAVAAALPTAPPDSL